MRTESKRAIQIPEPTMVRESFWSNFNCFGIFYVRMPVAIRSSLAFILIAKYFILEDLSTSVEFLVRLSAGSDPTVPIKRRLLPSTTNFNSLPCSTLAFRKALFWDPFCTFYTQNFSLHSFLINLSQTTPSCARFLQSRSNRHPSPKHAGLHFRCKDMDIKQTQTADVKTWMTSNKLKLNDKTEWLLIASN